MYQAEVDMIMCIMNINENEHNSMLKPIRKLCSLCSFSFRCLDSSNSQNSFIMHKVLYCTMVKGTFAP